MSERNQNARSTNNSALRLTPLAMALQGTLLCVALGMFIPVDDAYAQNTTGNTVSQQYAIPAGALDVMLDRFARHAGINLSYDPALVQGLTTSGLQGNYTAAAGLTTLLSDSPLEAVAQSGGGFVLQKNTEKTLPVISVNAPVAEGVTEGTGSYTTHASSTATKFDLPLRKTPQSVSIVTRQQMDDQGLSTIADVLEQTPGIVVSRENSEGYNFFSRGFAVENFQYDGIPSLSTDGGNVRDNYSIASMAMYDRIEILKGATGLLNGAGMPSGVVNFVRKRPTKTFQGSLTAGAGSWSNYKGELDLSGPLSESGHLRGRVVAAHQDQHTYIDYQKSKQNIFYGIIEADLTPATTASIGFDYQKTDNNASSNGHLPAFYSDGRTVKFRRSMNPADKWTFRNQETTNVFADIAHTFANDWMVKATISQKNYASRELISGIVGTVNAANNNVGHYYGYGVRFDTDKKEDAVNVQASGPYSLFGRTHELVLGYSHSTSKATSTARDGISDAIVDNAFEWDNNATEPTSYVLDRLFDIHVKQEVFYAATAIKPTDRFTFIAGSRFSNYEWSLTPVYGWSAAGTMKENNRVTPYFGATFDLDDHHTVYASYTDVFKPQAYNFDKDNKQLAPLTGKSYEIGAKGEYWDGKLNTSLALFQIKQNNKAVEDPSGALLPNGDAAMIGVPGVTTKGVELTVTGQLQPGWQIHAGYTYSQSRDKEDQPITTEQPEQLFKLATTYRLPGAWSKLLVGANLHWQNKTYFDSYISSTVGTARFEQASYTVLGLVAAYDVSNNVKLSLQINNLFDKHYYSSIAQRGAVYWGAPRNAQATLKYTF